MASAEDLSTQHRVWEDWAQADPLWAILSDPAQRGGKWDPGEFFASGHREIEIALAEVAAQSLDLRTGRALDFGCGVGRLTLALGAVFDRADGVDISETMVDLARKYNDLGERVEYHVNLAPDLALVGSSMSRRAAPAVPTGTASATRCATKAETRISRRMDPAAGGGCSVVGRGPDLSVFR